jgi:ATP-binding cassette, subfamily B, bacterial CvaB/MchF/RaxB
MPGLNVLDDLNFSWRRKVSLVLQTEGAECGLACLAMVAAYHGYKTDLPSLRQRHSISLKGMNLMHLMQVAGRMDMSCRPLRVELEALKHISLPTILHWDLNHFVVLKQIKDGNVIIHDPAIGLVKMELNEASKHFTGVAVEVKPTIKFEKRTERQSIKLRGLMGKVRGLKTSLLQIFVLAFTLEVFGLIGPFLTQWIVDDTLVSGDKDLLAVIALGILLLGTLKIMVTLVRSWILLYLSNTLNVQWVANVMGHLLRLPVAFFEKRHIGDIVSRFSSISAIQHTLTTTFVAGVIDGMMALVTLVMMLVYNRALGFIALGAVVLYAGLRIARYERLRVASEGQIVREARQQSYFMETVRSIQAVKIFNRLTDRKVRFLKLVVDTTNSDIEIQRLNITFQTINAFIVMVEGVLILWLGSKLVLDRTFTIGMLVAFIAYKDQFTSSIVSLIDKGVEVWMLKLQAERLSDIVLAEPEPFTEQPFLNTESIKPSIELRNIKFRYADSEPWIMQNLDLQVTAGESVVLVGPSGCGKTTLLKIMMGQLTPLEGEVIIGGVPLTQLGLDQYRNMIGAVMQDDQLFAGSLADNVSFFDNTIDQQWIEECARLAKIHDDIQKMPMGYNTLIGDMGTSLSGGQRQRIFLARALYKRPSILFLDEATSHLDVALEKEIASAVSELQLTRIVIAHRPEMIATGGRVIELTAHAHEL